MGKCKKCGVKLTHKNRAKVLVVDIQRFTDGTTDPLTGRPLIVKTERSEMWDLVCKPCLQEIKAMAAKSEKGGAVKLPVVE